jgi:hypothetical protein
VKLETIINENHSLHITKRIPADFPEQNLIAHDHLGATDANADIGFCRNVRNEKD